MASSSEGMADNSLSSTVALAGGMPPRPIEVPRQGPRVPSKVPRHLYERNSEHPPFCVHTLRKGCRQWHRVLAKEFQYRPELGCHQLHLALLPVSVGVGSDVHPFSSFPL